MTTAATMAAQPSVPMDKLALIRLKIRDRKSELKKEFDAEYARLSEQEKIIGAEFLRRAQEMGVDKFSIEGVATVFFVENTKVSGSDWSAFGEFLKDHDPLEFMEKRVSSTAIKNYMKANEGEVPPGISVFRELETRVRRINEKE